jgi:DNA polymerase I-like protein with 3'-5' exonuclease and polymerase domains
MKTYALDFETYYDKRCSIRTLGPLGYFSHPEFDAYLLTVKGTDGTEFVGHPKDFNWKLLIGNTALSHNAAFDEALYLYGATQSWWPEVTPVAWHCTADLAAYCRLPRSLKGATHTAFGLEVDKTTRDNMSGKRWESMTDEFRKEVSAYAVKDAELCLRLWEEFGDRWPEEERIISTLNRRICQGGIPIDTDLLKKQLETINEKLFEAESNIPWLGSKPLLSRAAFDEECQKVGLEPPASLAKTNPESKKWMDYNSQKHDWIEATQNWRRINALKKKVESFDVATMPDGRYYGGFMYFGAHTGRFSGGGGNLNLQNLPREETFGINLRNLISTKEDKRLVVADLSQIEVRTLCWLAGDKDMLKEIAESEDIYEAFAIRFNQWKKENGLLKQYPKLRHKIKAMVLGCGYGAGKQRFADMSGMTQKEADAAVDIYRNSMSPVTRLWRQYNADISGAYNMSGQRMPTPFTVDLPSGRVLDYGLISVDKVEGGRIQYTAHFPKGAKMIPIKLWGGFVAENASQALARDIFSDMLVRVANAGHNIIMHVHDEIVVEADADKADDALADILSIMSTPPEWIADIPLAAEGTTLTRYTK